MSIVGYVRW